MNRDKSSYQCVRTPPVPSRPFGAVASCLAALILLVACGRGDGDAAPPVSSTTATSLSTTTTALPIAGDVNAVVLDSYLKAARAVEEAEKIPDPTYPALAHHFTGEIYKEVVKQIYILKTNGLVVWGNTVDNARVVSVSGDRAVVWNCIRTDTERYDAKTGEVQNPTGPLTVGFIETLVLQGGVWKVDGRTKDERPCAG